ncbi:unnamed protein product [Closterium sp. NIES-54]
MRPPWVDGLSLKDLKEAIDSRITSLLSRYPNCFAHMDVNNEMLHGGFFSSRCGPSIVPRMFQFAAQIAPSLVLFLNEYHIEDGEDEKSRPEKYAQFARQLIASGAPVGGLGTQCHISAPVGAHMRHAWSILADVGANKLPHLPHQPPPWDLLPFLVSSSIRPHTPPSPSPSPPSRPFLPLIPVLAGFPISPINPHLGISASGSVPPGAALLLCDDVAAEGSFLLLHLLKSHLLSPPLQGGGAGARQGEGQGEGGCRGGGEGLHMADVTSTTVTCLLSLLTDQKLEKYLLSLFTATLLLSSILLPPLHFPLLSFSSSSSQGVHFTDLCRQHRLAIIDGQSQAYTWQPDGLDPRVCLQQENQKEMPHQDQQQKEMPLQQQQQQQQAGVYRFSPPVPFSPPPHPPSQTLPSNGYPPHSANASPLRALYSSICAAVSPIGCPHSSQPAHTPSHPSQPPSHPTEPFSRTAPPATTQPAAGSGAGAATSPSPSGAADVAPPARCGGQLCIIIDDVSLLETCAGGDSRLVMDFLSACRGLCTKHHVLSYTPITIHAQRTELNVHAFHHRFVGLSLSPPFRGLKPFTTVSWA